MKNDRDSSLDEYRKRVEDKMNRLQPVYVYKEKNFDVYM